MRTTKTWNKVRYVLAAVLLILALCMALAGFGTYNASAAMMSNPVVKDDFGNAVNNGKVDETKWVKVADEGNTVAQPAGNLESYLRFQKAAAGDNAKAYTTDAYAIKSVTFDVFFSEGFIGGASNWLGLSVQNDPASASIYGSYLLIRGNQIAANGPTVSNNKTEGTTNTYQSLLELETNDITGQWITFQYEFTAANEFNLYIAKRGNAFEADKKLFATYTGASTAVWNSGKLLFGVAGIESGAFCGVDNVIVEPAEGEKVVEDFSSVENCIVSTSGTKTNLLVFSNNALEFKESPKDARIVAKTPVELDESILEDFVVLEADFHLTLEQGGVSFLIGVPSSSGSITAESVRELTITADGKGVFSAYGADGNKTAIGLIDAPETKEIALESVKTEDGGYIGVTVNKNGVMEIFENGTLVATYPVESYEGYVAFASAAEGTQAKMKTVEVNAYTYFVPVTKSLTNNFSTDYLGAGEAMDFYMTSTPNNSMTIANGKLQFNGCSDGSVFGPMHEYDDFTMDYKLCNIYVATEERNAAYYEDSVENNIIDRTAPNRWIGFDFGRKNADLNAYGSYLMLYFNITGKGATTSVNAFVTKGATMPEKLNITMVEKIPTSYFNDVSYDGVNVMKEDVKASNAVCIRWVAKNNVLELHMKRAKDLAYTKYAEITGVETSGSVAICCTGFTFLEIDDFSIANNSNVYVCASNEAPKTEIVEVEPEYDYNKYLNPGNFDEELNLLDKASSSGCNGSITAACVPALLTMLGAAAIVGKKRK